MSTVLQFSGGKDSLACLYLLEPRWSEITVAWVNTGAAFPETLEQMERIRALVPHFHEIRSRQSIETEGYPVDVLPISSTSLGQQVEGAKDHRFQSRYACCAAALWIPMQQAMRELGATIIIRGEKRADHMRGGLLDGQVVEGIEYQFPLIDWTDAEVLAYLKERGIALPKNYELMSTSLDCWNCTAYLAQNVQKFTYLREHHPEKYWHVRSVLADLQTALSKSLQPMWDIQS